MWSERYTHYVCLFCFSIYIYKYITLGLSRKPFLKCNLYYKYLMHIIRCHATIPLEDMEKKKRNRLIFRVFHIRYKWTEWKKFIRNYLTAVTGMYSHVYKNMYVDVLWKIKEPRAYTNINMNSVNKIFWWLNELKFIFCIFQNSTHNRIKW